MSIRRGVRWSGLTLLASLFVLGTVSGLHGQEDRGWLGIELADTGDFAITWVREGSPADRAGLRVNDVILEVNGVRLTRENKSEREANPFAQLQVGVDGVITVRRDGRRLEMTVVPGSWVDAFGYDKPPTHEAAVGSGWDSVAVQLKKLKEHHLQMQVALRTAEQALDRVEVQTDLSRQQRRVAVALRTEIDSLSRALAMSQRRIRAHADSLAVRTLRVRPIEPEAEVRVVVPEAGESRTIVIYRDAVAGARFKELDAGQAEYFGVSDGLLIVEVAEDTPAENAGLQEFDVVVAVNGEPVTTIAELRRHIGRGPVELTYVRRGEESTCKIGSE